MKRTFDPYRSIITVLIVLVTFSGVASWAKKPLQPDQAPKPAATKPVTQKPAPAKPTTVKPTTVKPVLDPFAGRIRVRRPVVERERDLSPFHRGTRPSKRPGGKSGAINSY